MKKAWIPIVVLAVLIGGGLYYAFRPPVPVETEKPKVVLVFPVTVDAFEQFRTECTAELEKNGVEVEWLSAEGDPSRFNTSVKAAVMKKPKVLVTIGTQITDTAFGPQFENDLPNAVVASCISDPTKVNALTKINLMPPRLRPVAIVSDAPEEDMYSLSGVVLERLTGPGGSFGVIYNEAEINSKNTALKLAAAAQSRGLKFVPGIITGGGDVDRVTKTLLAQGVNALCIPHDKYAVGRATTIVNLALGSPKPVPVFTLDDGTVKKDRAPVGVSVSYSELGRMTAKTCLKILNGENPADMPIVQQKRASVYINRETMEQCGIKLPEDILKSAVFVPANTK